MKLQGVWLCFSGLMSVVMVGLINLRRKGEDREERLMKFKSIKLRVTGDLLSEYQTEIIHIRGVIAKTQAEVKDLGMEFDALHIKELEKKDEMDACDGKTKHMTDEEASIALQSMHLKAEFEKQKVRWEVELASLKQQASQRSKVCDFVKKDSKEGRKMCGDEVIIEAPKIKAQRDTKEDTPKIPKEDTPKIPKEDTPKKMPKEDTPKKMPKEDTPKKMPKEDTPKKMPKEER